MSPHWSLPEEQCQVMKELIVEYRRSLCYGTIAITIVLFSSLLTLYFSGQFTGTTAPKDTLFSNRDYGEIPFDTYDALIACREKAREEFGSSLVRTHADWHSSRFEPDRQSYLVALYADVGALDIFEEAYIYCYVDPKDYVVTYFKAYDSRQRPMLSRFSFGDLISAFSSDPNKTVKSQ